MKNCRHHLKHRRRPVGEARIKIPNRASIHERPKEADGRRIGDLEMDTIVGKNNKGAIVTIIDRSTDWLVMKKLPHGKEAFAKNVSQQRIKMIQRKINARLREKLNFLTPDEFVYKKTL